jgi:hypothetical protein
MRAALADGAISERLAARLPLFFAMRGKSPLTGRHHLVTPCPASATAESVRQLPWWAAGY